MCTRDTNESCVSTYSQSLAETGAGLQPIICGATLI